jgi:hypothetical protein
MTNLKLKSPVPFPASVVGAGGIKVSKASGEWTIQPDFSALATITASNLGDPTSKEVWVYDPVTLDYNTLTLAALGDALYSATSTTSLAIGTGSKTFTTQSGKDFGVGSWVFASSNADPTNFMLGQVTSYSATSLVVNVTTIGGTGTKADWTIRASSSPGSAGKSAGHSYLWNTSTSGDPGSGKLLGNNAAIASITAINISETDHDGNALASNIATWDDSTSTIHGRLKIYDPVVPTNYAYFDITGTNVDNGTYDTLTVSYVGTGGSFTASQALCVLFIPKGDKGDVGPSGATGISGTPTANHFASFANSTTIQDAGAIPTGIVKGNGTTLSGATAGTDFMKPDTTSGLTAGFTATSYSAGTKSTGTFTPDPTLGNFQHYTNGGAHTLAPPASVCTMVIECTNSTAGAITTSGFDVVSGDTYSSTGTKKHIFYITRTNSYKQLHVQYVTGT